MGRYTQVFIAQLVQTTACNVLHPVQQRCARRLLISVMPRDVRRGLRAVGFERRFLLHRPLCVKPAHTPIDPHVLDRGSTGTAAIAHPPFHIVLHEAAYLVLLGMWD